MPENKKLARDGLIGVLNMPVANNFKGLGITPLAVQLGLTPEQTNGHWCKRCQGIWFGYTLEVQCPVCGNRDG
jgi:rubrerythrin